MKGQKLNINIMNTTQEMYKKKRKEYELE